MTHTRPLTPSDAPLIGGIIGESFADDPVNLWVFRNPAGMTPFYRSMARKLYLRRGFGHVTPDGTCGALWLPPGVSKDLPMWRMGGIIASMVRHGGPSSLKNGLKADAVLLGAKPKAPHYYLFAIGTLPTHQGQGLGSRIMEAGLETVDAAQMPAYLESSKYSNVPFYQKYGFEVIEQVTPAPGAPSLWLMWRPAKGMRSIGARSIG